MREKISFEEFRENFADHLGVDQNTIERDTNILTDLGVDSLSLINVMFQMEKEYGIKFRGEDKIMTQTLGKAYELLISYLE